MLYFAFILSALISYLLGSLNFGIILSRRLEKDDIRTHGSGNAGSTNMLRNYGKKLAVMTIIGDMLKVAVAIFITLGLFNLMNLNDAFVSIENNVDKNMLLKSFSGFFCVLGHIFPCFFNFKGGKGVATSGGMVFIIDWRIALILLALFIFIVLITKYVSLGSIIMAICYPIFIYVFHKSIILTSIAFVFTLIVIIAHRENIKKLIHGKESKISLKKIK